MCCQLWLMVEWMEEKQSAGWAPPRVDRPLVGTPYVGVRSYLGACYAPKYRLLVARRYENVRTYVRTYV